MISHLLFATDFSPPADAAFALLLGLAARGRWRVSLIHVCVPVDSWLAAAYQQIDPEYFELFEAELKLLAGQRMEALAWDLAKAGVPAASYCLSGQPGAQIVEFARAEACDLILLGSRGLSAPAAVLLGSISRYVLHHAPCPVLVVPAGAQHLSAQPGIQPG